MEYLHRMFDGMLHDYLEAFGAVLIEGPKWCGKTTTALQQAKSVLRLQDPDIRDGLLSTAAIKPSLLLEGDNPRLIDEWQDAPLLWDAVRMRVDMLDKTGLFILTGSNSVDESKILHSGIGRIVRMKMLPMSLYESRESVGNISLKELFDNPSLDIDGKISPLSIEQLIFAACRGGWPASLSRKGENAQLLVARSYLESICKVDIKTIDKTERNENLSKAVLKTYARNISTLAKKSSMLKDVRMSYGDCSDKTFDSYVKALFRLFVLEDVAAWSPAVRSASAIRRGAKREFVDPSIAVAALGLTPDSLKLDLKTFGFIFECMGIRDLKAYSQALGGSVSYYHDRYDLEADAVLHLADGRYALIEFKLGSKEIDEGAAHLFEIKQLVEDFNKKERQIKLREPDLLMVITGGQMAYSRPDGVKVIPLGCLKD